MTIQYITQDLTKVNHGIVAHGCNCRGKMGAGVAKDIKEKWPKAFDGYVYMLTEMSKTPRGVRLGQVLFVRVEETAISQVIVANMLTQLNYGREPIRYADPIAIKKAMKLVIHRAIREDLPIYMSKVGCSLGGLDWDTDVRPIIEELDNEYNCTIYVCSK